MAKGKRKGNGGKAGMRAKKAAQRKWEKRKDVIFAASVGASFYVVGHLVEATLHPFTKPLAELIKQGLLFYFRNRWAGMKRSDLDSMVSIELVSLSAGANVEAELLVLKERVHRALLSHQPELAIYVRMYGLEAASAHLQGAMERVVSDKEFLRAPGLEAKARILETRFNGYFAPRFRNGWSFHKMPELIGPPKFRFTEVRPT